jgi:hypothetical protein
MPPSVVEFLDPIKDKGWRPLALGAMLYASRYEGSRYLSVDQLRAILRRARLPKVNSVNLHNVLNRSGALVDYRTSAAGRKEWVLTLAGHEWIMPQIPVAFTPIDTASDVDDLGRLSAKVKESDVKDYLDEAIICLRAGASRACVVFLWIGAVRSLQRKLLFYPEASVNTTLQKHDPKARMIKSLDDFEYIKESTLLLASQELGIFDKGERQMLEQALLIAA